MFLVALPAIGRTRTWQEWLSLALGAWIFAAPWALGFAGGPFPAAAWDHWTVGALVVVLSGANLGTLRSETAESMR